MKRRILLTGATGRIGSELARRLADYDEVALRVLVRSPEKATRLSAPGVEVVKGAFEDAASLRVALEGMDTVVLITPFGPTASDQAHAAIVAAQQAHVRRIVRLSAIKANPSGPCESYRQHGRIDAEIQSSGLAYTIVRPTAFMQTSFMPATETILSQSFFLPTVGDGRYSTVDTRDIVDVFEQILLSDEYDGEILTLTSPASMSLYEAARIFSKELDREITYVPVPPAEIEARFRGKGFSGWALEVFCDYSAAFRHNHQDIVTGDVERVTGHPARSLETFIREVFLPVLGH